MVTRLEIAESLYSQYKDTHCYQNMIRASLIMNEQDFIEDYKRTTGHKLNRVIKNRYFINI